MRILLFTVVILLVAGSCNLPQSEDKKSFRDYQKTETQEEKDKRMQWWRDAGFGMFIHWGLYAVPAGQYGEETNHAEWIQETADIPVKEYEKYTEGFNPVQFDAKEWVRIAKDAGMKYIVITSKHHDGFCLWDSKASDYDIIDRTPYKKDVLKELADACKDQGIVLCFYHSIMDWHHPDAQGINHPDYNYGKGSNPNFPDYVENYLTPQLKELLNNYGKIGVLWFDGEWIAEWTEEQGKDMYNLLRNIQPDIIINNRVGKGRQGMEGMNANENAAGDFGTPEQEILDGSSDLDWESCMTMNDHWGYNKFDANFKSAALLIHNLVDIAAKGGNYLLNVGPTPEGLIPLESIERLQKVGAWMKVNGEVIHNSRGTKPYREHDNIYYIRSKYDEYLYAVLTQWPGSSVQIKYAVPDPGSDISLLGYDKPLEWDIKPSAGININLPDGWQNEEARPVKYAWVIRMKGRQAEVAEAPEFFVDNKLIVKKALLSDPVEVSLKSKTEGAKIYYSLNGDGITSKLAIYTEPIAVDRTLTIDAMAIQEGYVSSPSSQISLLKMSAFKAIKYTFPYSSKYAALGDLSLGDGMFGSEDNIHENWLGFEGVDIVANIDLGGEKFIS
nr:alpha-L-fucosidase [Bacteroidota bacterium]